MAPYTSEIRISLRHFTYLQTDEQCGTLYASNHTLASKLTKYTLYVNLFLRGKFRRRRTCRQTTGRTVNSAVIYYLSDLLQMIIFMRFLLTLKAQDDTNMASNNDLIELWAILTCHMLAPWEPLHDWAPLWYLMAALSSPWLGHGTALSWPGSDSLARNIMGPRLHPGLLWASPALQAGIMCLWQNTQHSDWQNGINCAAT